jgi:hypothetical protein
MNPEQYLEHIGVIGMKWGHRKARPSKAVVRTANALLKNRKNATEEELNDALASIGVNRKGRRIKGFDPASPEGMAQAKAFVEKYSKHSALLEQKNRERGMKQIAVIAGLSVIALLSPAVLKTLAWATGTTTYIGSLH